jgi:hypothetical protein
VTYPLYYRLCQIHEDRVWRSPETYRARDERHVRQAVIGACSADGVTRWAETVDGDILFGLIGKPVRGSLVDGSVERIDEIRTKYGER